MRVFAPTFAPSPFWGRALLYPVVRREPDMDMERPAEEGVMFVSRYQKWYARGDSNSRPAV